MPENRRETLQRVLQLDESAMRNDTLFAATRKQEPKDQRQTLIIGIGGSGVDSIYTSYRLMREKLNPNFHNYVKFIVVDAAINKLEYAKRVGIPYIDISTPGATERISQYENRPEYYKSWMPKKFSENFDSEGAGRMRMVGRAKLYDSSHDGGTTNDDVLRKQIREVVASFQATLPLDIILVSGTAGGTGGGTVIDVAAMARAVCRERKEVRLYGYLFLPDTVEEFLSDKKDLNQARANGYAFLKELESYMCLMHDSERKEEWKVPESTLYPLITLDHITPLFDDIALISGKYKESKNLISECLANMVSKMDQDAFSHKEFYSNKDASRNAKLCKDNATNGGLLKNDFHCEDSHIYSGIGVSTASIPEEIVIPNIVGNTCERLYKIDEMYHFRREKNPPTRQEASVALRRFFNWNENTKLDENSLWMLVDRQVKSKAALNENKGNITAADITTGNTKSYEDGFLVESHKTKTDDEIKIWLQKQYENFMEQAMEIMYNDGPRMIKFLYEGTGPCDRNGKPENYEDISLKRMLEQVEAQLRKAKTEVITRPTGKTVKPGFFGGISNSINGNVNRWKSAIKQYFEAEICKSTFTNMSGDNGIFAIGLKNKIKEFVEQCEIFAEEVEMLGDFYHGKGRPLDADDYHIFHKAGDDGINVNLCDDNDVFLWVKAKVREKINNVNMQDLRRKLVDDFMRNREKWVGGTKGEARSRFDSILSECCKVGSRAPVDEEVFSLDAGAYFEKKLEGVSDSELYDRAKALIAPIVKLLLDKGRPSLATRETRPTNCFIFLPQALSTGKYSSALIKAFGDALPSQNKQVLSSDTATKIICYQTSVANALYELTDIAKWEAAYEGGFGRYVHLNQGEYGPFKEEEAESAEQGQRELFGKNLNWYHYPALALNLNHVENISSKEGEYLRKVFNPIFDYALKEKIIYRDGNDQAGYYYRMCIILDHWTNFRIDGYSQKQGGRFMRGEPLFDYWAGLPDNKSTGSTDVKRDILLENSGFFSEPFQKQDAMNARVTEAEFDAKVLEYTKAILRKDTWLFRQLRNTLYRYWEIGRAMDACDTTAGIEEDIKNFIRYLQVGIVYQVDNDWLIRGYGGSGIRLCSFGLRETLLFEEKDKAVYDNMELRLPVILDRFMNCEMYRKDKDELERQRREIIESQDNNEALKELIARCCDEHREENGRFTSMLRNLKGSPEERERALRNMLPGKRTEQEIEVYKLKKLYEELGKIYMKY